MAISGIPSTRVSEQFMQQRLLSQLQSDQRAIFQLQQQIGTARRILLPSDDAPAALRGQSLQTLLEQKVQIQKNLHTNQSFLNASDSVLSNVSGLLAGVRGTVLGVNDSFSSDVERQSAVREINEVIRQLVDVGNQQFRDRYLFGGSQTNRPPFEFVDGYVRYNGNEGVLRSYADLDVLFATSVSGNQVFGAISEPVRGTADLNPVITHDTKLSALRGGLGVTLGAIQVSDGTQSRTVDLGRAETVGDVVKLLEAHPPAGRTVSVRLSQHGFQIELDAAGGGNLTVTEVGQGTTAAQLGILQKTGVLTGPLIGGDLDPAVVKTTRMDDLLGSRAEAVVASPGSGNDLIIAAARRGDEFNGIEVSFVDGGPAALGNESALYDPVAGTLVVTIAGGFSTANHVVEAIEGDPALQGLFTARLDSREPGNDGDGFVSVTAAGTLQGGGGEEFDQQSGLQIYNGGRTYTLDLSAAETVEDVLNIINSSGASVLAAINAAGTGIDVRSRLSGAEFSIGENGGRTASQLGIRTLDEQVKLKDLNFGLGVLSGPGADFQIRRKDGVRLDIDISGSKSVQDVLDAVNNHPDNQDPAGAVVARLATYGNGIELTTADTVSSGALSVVTLNGSEAAWHLGLVPQGENASGPAVPVDGQETLVGRDVNRQEVEGVFNALIKMAQALEKNDTNQITRTIAQLDRAAINVNFARGEIGARSQGVDIQLARLDVEEVELRDALSKELDIDLAEAISSFTARQAALQASLQTTAFISQLTLIDYL